MIYSDIFGFWKFEIVNFSRDSLSTVSVSFLGCHDFIPIKIGSWHEGSIMLKNLPNPYEKRQLWNKHF